MRRSPERQFAGKPSATCPRGLLSALCLGLFALCPLASAQIFVTSTADSGAGSLRQAIWDASAIPVATEEIVTIDLQLIQDMSPGPGRAVVTLATSLVLSRSVYITSSGSGGKPLVRLSGGPAFVLSPANAQSRYILHNLTLGLTESRIPGGCVAYDSNYMPANLLLYQCDLMGAEVLPLPTSTKKDGFGGAVYFADRTLGHASELKIVGCLFADNWVKSDLPTGQRKPQGAAVFVSNSKVIIEDTRFDLNRCDSDFETAGGALKILGSQGPAEIRRCTFSRNHCDVGPGAISCSADPSGLPASLLLEDSMIEGNYGTGVLTLGDGTASAPASAVIRNTTFAANSSDSISALRFFPSFGNVSLVHCTIAQNVHLSKTGSAVSIAANGNDMKFSRCVIAGNRHISMSQTPGNSPDLTFTGSGGKFLSLGYNFIGNPDPNSPVQASPSDLTGTDAAPLDPRLAKPGDYGGPVRSCPPLPDSPLVDAIPNAANVLAADQRGTSRPQGNAADIGAVELPRIPYDAWDDQIPNPADRDPLADPDHDGLENRREYFFGTNPMVANLPPVRMVVENSSLYFEVIRSASVRPAFFGGSVVETSTSLLPGSWSPASNGVSTPETDGSLDRIRTRYPVIPWLEPRAFFRVGVW